MDGSGLGAQVTFVFFYFGFSIVQTVFKASLMLLLEVRKRLGVSVWFFCVV